MERNVDENRVQKKNIFQCSFLHRPVNSLTLRKILSTGVTALLSVTEPALYGCLIRLRKPLISAIIAAAITGVFVGMFDVRAYATASCSFLTLPIFLGGTMQNFVFACIAAVLATALGFVITWIVGFDE